MDFIKTYIAQIVFVILILALVIILLRKGAKKGVKEMLFYLVTQAEKAFGAGTGEIKFASVVTWLYERMPTSFRAVLTQKEISALIEDAVVRMKEYLKENDEIKKFVSEQDT